MNVNSIFNYTAISALANEDNTTTTTTTTIPGTTTTTIPGEVEEIETFDGPEETTTTTIPEETETLQLLLQLQLYLNGNNQQI